jgi:UDP-N-acetylglucosamine--N-acetylmuramyl-(pentapeptide) pyrophosphoryl-undecaprenol N-acetylglucosamine transferase
VNTVAQKRKIVFAVGGTGGHLFPAQALARDVKAKLPQTQVLFMGSGLSSSRYFFTKEFPSIDIQSSTPFKKRPLDFFKAVQKLLKGIWKSLGHLRQEKPDLVIGFGSFHAFPVLFSALLRKTPIVLFESNVIPGRVIRFFSRFAKCTAVQFPKAGENLKGNVVETKMPLWDRDRLSEFTREEAAKYFNLKADVTTLLVFGGSQGARAINRLFCEAMQDWQKRPAFQVIHLTGDVASCHEALLCYKKLSIPAQVKVFEDRMPLAWRLADLAICRSGASTIAELLAYRVPAVLIPYPHASDDHQLHNAQDFAKEIKSAIVLPERHLNRQNLQEKLHHLLQAQEKELKAMHNAILQFEESSARPTLFSILEKFL